MYDSATGCIDEASSYAFIDESVRIDCRGFLRDIGMDLWVTTTYYRFSECKLCHGNDEGVLV